MLSLIVGSIGWNSTVGRWVRCDNTTVLGDDVNIKDELLVNGASGLFIIDRSMTHSLALKRILPSHFSSSSQVHLCLDYGTGNRYVDRSCDFIHTAACEGSGCAFHIITQNTDIARCPPCFTMDHNLSVQLLDQFRVILWTLISIQTLDHFPFTLTTRSHLPETPNRDGAQVRFYTYKSSRYSTSKVSVIPLHAANLHCGRYLLACMGRAGALYPHHWSHYKKKACAGYSLLIDQPSSLSDHCICAKERCSL